MVGVTRDRGSEGVGEGGEGTGGGRPFISDKENETS